MLGEGLDICPREAGRYHGFWGHPTGVLPRCNPPSLQWLLLCADTVPDSLVPDDRRCFQSCHLLA